MQTVRSSQARLFLPIAFTSSIITTMNEENIFGGSENNPLFPAIKSVVEGTYIDQTVTLFVKNGKVLITTNQTVIGRFSENDKDTLFSFASDLRSSLEEDIREF